MKIGQYCNVVGTSNWSNFCRLSRRAGLSAIAGLSCYCKSIILAWMHVVWAILRQNRLRGSDLQGWAGKTQKVTRSSHRNDVSPLTQGLRYRTACDKKMARVTWTKRFVSLSAVQSCKQFNISWFHIIYRNSRGLQSQTVILSITALPTNLEYYGTFLMSKYGTSAVAATKCMDSKHSLTRLTGNFILQWAACNALASRSSAASSFTCLWTYRVREKNSPPKHVKITLWIENVSD